METLEPIVVTVAAEHWYWEFGSKSASACLQHCGVWLGTADNSELHSERNGHEPDYIDI